MVRALNEGPGTLLAEGQPLIVGVAKPQPGRPTAIAVRLGESDDSSTQLMDGQLARWY
jgi:hypothetical protein